MLLVWSILNGYSSKDYPHKNDYQHQHRPHQVAIPIFEEEEVSAILGWMGGVYRGWTWGIDWTGGALHLQLFLLDHDSQQILHPQQHDQQNPHQRLHGHHDHRHQHRRPQGSDFWAWVDSRGRSFAMTIVCSCLWPSWPALLGTPLSLCTQSS